VSNAYGEKISFWGASIRNVSPFCPSTTTMSPTAGSVWLGTTFEVSLGHPAKERVAGVD